jgi:methylated-DNA-protein-cysteine methyltransferase related protein
VHEPKRKTRKISRYEIIYRIIRGIPEGKVVTYGQIAKLAGIAGYARQVGYALHALPGNSNVPWHRVVNAKGQISLRSNAASTQKSLLEKEGIVFDSEDRVSLKVYGWLLVDGQ